jgi:hypothetical protein
LGPLLLSILPSEDVLKLTTIVLNTKQATRLQLQLVETEILARSTSAGVGPIAVIVAKKRIPLQAPRKGAMVPCVGQKPGLLSVAAAVLSLPLPLPLLILLLKDVLKHTRMALNTKQDQTQPFPEKEVIARSTSARAGLIAAIVAMKLTPLRTLIKGATVPCAGQPHGLMSRAAVVLSRLLDLPCLRQLRNGTRMDAPMSTLRTTPTTKQVVLSQFQ